MILQQNERKNKQRQRDKRTVPGIIRQLRGYLRCILVLFAICVLSLTYWTCSASAENLGDCSHGYVNDIKLRVAVSGLTDNIPNYVFDQQTTEYNLTLYNGGSIGILANVSGEELFYQIAVNGTAYGNRKLQSISGYDKDIKLTGSSSLKINQLECGTNTFTVRIGKSEDNMTLTDYDEYVFHYTLKPSFVNMTVSEVVEDEKTTALSLSPEYKKGIWYLEDKFTAYSETSKISLSLEFKTPSTTCYLGMTDEKTINSKVAQIINLADYWNNEIEMAVLPLRLVYKNGDTELSTTNYLFVSKEQKALSPVITGQPTGITCNKEETPTLTVTAQVPDGGTIGYQWYSGTNEYFLTAVPGQTSNTFTLSQSDTSLAGTKYYAIHRKPHRGY